ncbi:hypothetical protein VOLCADRAFT_93543 [Volvox carteri f. nagariensis]|uniref:isoleucine--tRNA ligase n=1 Tax=Volvox carteri f. nagariensis TaxID=3068 RepID=D8U2E2_VOLCA|nr:uncharacterized protein VOLCADRAFT_93543 [Volvox carteri f. nagariensis]EFJ46048.1 hypothetical protein VOLCADRAFT_93543 [Volvox carteri f. nagariensis]|eukprot:XP_002952798.1 hypothetical protein VOLCADRAFT_93543 [Volvox carteri f. nagariensis]
MALGCIARVIGPVALPGVCAVRAGFRIRTPQMLHSTVTLAKGGSSAAGAPTAAGSVADSSAKKGKRGPREEGSDDVSGPYSSTVRLPTTEFSLRANSPIREPQIQQYWEQHATYEALVEGNTGESYTLHDGPPYANGDLHIGHALNKILKDFINRYQLLQGRRAKFVPGWDTHGLPIELKVLQSLKEKERKELGVLELRAKAREFALRTIDAQRTQFKRYGVWGDWSSPYVTLEPSYEAAQLRVFGKMFLNGHIYRGLKPVHWSPSSRTALAEAELEYPEGHRSTAVYVAMPLVAVGEKAGEEMKQALQGAGFAIWTTTPWTIPANLAVAVNDQLDYCVVEAQELVGRLAEKTGVELKVLATAKGSELEGCSYRHPLYDRTSPLVIGGDYITTETGTPVDDAGNFTTEAGPFAGLNVQGEGNKAVVAALREAGVLLKDELYEHKYPYDWRTKKPTIFRATSQWFASVEGFRGAALEAIRGVQWIPAAGLNRITGMTEGRSDWCISRQRKWGVPIPVFYDTETDEPLLTSETIEHITGLVSQYGSDCWWTLSVSELLPPSLRHLAPRLRRGEDTMDVWFDSGSSWAGVLQADAVWAGLSYPADLYLEGSDQHRGWFQSSLLTSVAANGIAPYKQVLTHGFVLDEKGQKMSKSLGNVVDPRVVIEGGKDVKQQPAYGADVLRLWVASVDYTSDVAIGSSILRQMADMYRKVRGTLRFLLGNLADYDPQVHAVPYEQLPSLDRYMLFRVSQLMNEVSAAYDSYQFFKVFQSLQRFVIVDLSNFYLDTAKDRLYIRRDSDPARRACQTVLDALLRSLMAALAPLVPHLAEDAWLNLPYARPAASVFQAGWVAPEPAWSGLRPEEVAAWSLAGEVRDAANVVLERARTSKLIGAGLEAKVVLHVSDPAAAAVLSSLDASRNGADELRYVLIVSQVELVSDAAVAKLCPFHETIPSTRGAGEITVGVTRAGGTKCARCWNYSLLVGSSSTSSVEDSSSSSSGSSELLSGLLCPGVCINLKVVNTVAHRKLDAICGGIVRG